jgi:hypothetical protein
MVDKGMEMVEVEWWVDMGLRIAMVKESEIESMGLHPRLTGSY